MTIATRHGLLLALLVGALLAGLVGMHHVAVAGEPGPAHVAAAHHAPADGPHGDHASTLLHLCLAVLAAVALLVVAMVLWWRPAPVPAAHARAAHRIRTRPRAPPRGAPARLALLCVLRT